MASYWRRDPSLRLGRDPLGGVVVPFVPDAPSQVRDDVAADFFEAPSGGGSIGTLAVTLGALVLAATATAAVQGAGATTLGGLGLAADAAVAVQGAATPTLGTLLLSSTATADVGGAASLTLGELAGASTGVVAVQGTTASTLGTLTLTASGTIQAETIGTANIVFGSLLASGAGQGAVQGSFSQSFAALTLDASGIESISGSGAITFGLLGVAGAGDSDSLIETVLVTSITGRDSIIKVPPGTIVSAGDLLVIDNEIMQVDQTQLAGSIIVSVLRGREGSKTAVHQAGSTIGYSSPERFRSLVYWRLIPWYPHP